MCSLDTIKDIARMLQLIPNDALLLHDRWVFCMAPVQTDDHDCMISLKVTECLVLDWLLRPSRYSMFL